MLACAQGDVAALTAMLACDARATTDSGGKARAARNVLHGADALARFFIGVAKKSDAAGLGVLVCELNGWPAAVLSRDGGVESVVILETDGARVFAVSVISNPDKLRAVTLSRRTAAC
ncbi:MAG: hypothetical protein IT374_01235 [Polyangiaceae bacterium]|nr:hypothetical protein [Polyangiaceae bacterium]